MMQRHSSTGVHLITVVGSHVALLPHMLAHYKGLGVDSLMVCIHLEEYGDRLYHTVADICSTYGATIVGAYAGHWLRCVNQFLYHEARHAHPEDWFLLADADELQVYPSDIHDLLCSLDKEGFDYVEGCFIDRLARDGSFPVVATEEPIWRQFPLGGTVTQPLLGGDMRKVVAAKGLLPIVSGQHLATDGKGCPAEQLFVPVHHFKWSAGILERLEHRAKFYRDNKDPIWEESQRFLDYCRQHGGRIDIADPNLFIADCSNGYPYWDIVKGLLNPQLSPDRRYTTLDDASTGLSIVTRSDH